MIIFLSFSLVFALTHASSVPPKKQVRSGRFFAFDTDETLLDLLDDMQDPLPHPDSMQSEEYHDETTQPYQEIYNPVKMKLDKKKDETKTKIPGDKKLALYNQNTGKFELISTNAGHIALPMKPVTTENGIFFYGGQHYQYGNPTHPTAPQAGNKTEEIKIFWSSVGDAIESAPFLPIQINVPDMISAMATFLANSIPFINRFTNPNQPRPAQKMPNEGYLKHDNNNYYSVEGNGIEDRELKNGPKLKENKPVSKIEKINSNKKRTKGSSKRIFKRPILRPTTAASPKDESKIWSQFGSTGEAVRYKNMPITRKKFHVADKEFFNFKNSDISNSPIMILNMPNRPMMYYNLKHQESSNKEEKEPVKNTIESNSTSTSTSNSSVVTLKRKLRGENKTNLKKEKKRVKNNQKLKQ